MDPYAYYTLTGMMPNNCDQSTMLSTLNGLPQVVQPSQHEQQQPGVQSSIIPGGTQPPLFFHPPLIRPINVPAVTLQIRQGTAPLLSQEVPLPAVATGDDSAFEPRVVNVVCSVNLGCKFDLTRIASMARNAEYKPKRFNGLTMRIKEPKATANIFDSGRLICMGTKSIESAKMASRKFARILQKLGYKVKFEEFKLINMVGSCKVNFKVRLELLHFSHSKFCFYESDLFPGLVYRMVSPKITILVFASGNVVLTGAKNESDIKQAFHKISSVLQKFKDENQNKLSS